MGPRFDLRVGRGPTCPTAHAWAHGHQRTLGFVAVSVLAAFGALNQYFADPTTGHPRLGWVTAAAVLLLDGFVAGAQSADLVAEPRATCLLMALGRVLIVAFGGDYWFLGHSSAFLVFGVALARAVAVRATPLGARQIAAAKLRVREVQEMRAGNRNLPTVVHAAAWAGLVMGPRDPVVV